MSNTIQFRRTTAILTLVAASIGGGLVAAFAVANHNHEPMYVTAHADSRISQLSNSFADTIEKASPAVVNIQSTRVVKASEQEGGGDNPLGNDPFFRQFFGRGGARQRPQRESGLGSGVIVDPSGYIVTNNHVVEKASTVKVTLLDKREFTAKVIGTDPQTDIAVVKIDASKLSAMPLGDADATRVGDLCFAIGNPFGQDHTVTMGIVSAKGRSLPGGEGANTRIQNFIQTDAAINPGNSGGALINARGELIGINTAILTGGGFGGEGGSIGIGFAVPVNMARSVMDQIIKSGKVSRGYMGVTLAPLTPDLAEKLDVKGVRGALVNSVQPGDPGAKAGLKQWDVITAIDGHSVEDYNALTLAVTQHSPGSTVTLDIVRDGKPSQVKVTLGQRPSGIDWNEKGKTPDDDSAQGDNDNQGGASARGVKVQPLTPEVAQQLQLPANTHGVVIDDVDPSSPAADTGLGQGDVITSIERQPVNSVGDFTRLMKQAQGKSVLVSVNHGGRDALLVIPAEK